MAQISSVFNLAIQIRYTILFGLAKQPTTAKYLLIEIDENQEKGAKTEDKGN